MVRLIISILLITSIVRGDCNNALNACINYNTELSNSLLLCNNYTHSLEKQVNKDEHPLIPWWGWGIAGIVVGGLIVHEVGK